MLSFFRKNFLNTTSKHKNLVLFFNFYSTSNLILSSLFLDFFLKKNWHFSTFLGELIHHLALTQFHTTPIFDFLLIYRLSKVRFLLETLIEPKLLPCTSYLPSKVYQTPLGLFYGLSYS